MVKNYKQGGLMPQKQVKVHTSTLGNVSAGNAGKG